MVGCVVGWWMVDGYTSAIWEHPRLISLGYLVDPNAPENCQFCSIGSTNTFLASVGSNYADRWRNFGILWAFIIFNIGAALGLYWLVRVPKKKLGGKKAKKE